MWSFIELADRHGGKVAFYQIPPSSLPLYLDAGLEVFKLGEMARVFLPSFSLEGSTRADLRYALKRGERDGLRFEMIPRERVASVIDEIEGISDEWLVKCAGEREKRFSVAAFHRDYVLSQPIALLRQNGEAVAFATVMTTDLREEVTVGLMRHKPGAASRYAMEYLFIRLIQYFRDQGYRSFSLGMVPLSGLRAHRLGPRWHRVARVIWLLGRRFYNFQGLRTFKGKFDPVWEPRYLAASGWFGRYLALIDIASLIGGGMRYITGSPATDGNRHTRFIKAAALAITAGTVLFPSRPASALETGNLGHVHEFNPVSAMRRLVVLFSDAGGWTSSASDDAAAALTSDGALVVGVDLPDYLARLDAHSDEACHDVGGTSTRSVDRFSASVATHDTSRQSSPASAKAARWRLPFLHTRQRRPLLARLATIRPSPCTPGLPYARRRAPKRTHRAASVTVRGRRCRASGWSHFPLVRITPGANASRR